MAEFEPIVGRYLPVRFDGVDYRIFVEEAGGAFSDLTGKPTPDGGSVVCSNGRLHAEVLELLAPR